MKKFLKNYFLFFAAHPIFYSLILATIAIIITYLWTGKTLPKESELKEPLIMVFVLMCIHATIVYIVIKKYITRNVKLWIEYLDDKHSYFFSYVSVNGKNIIFSRPIWIKGEVTYIHLPENYRYFNEKGLFAWFSVDYKLLCNYKNLLITVPVNILVNLNDKFNKSEVLTALTKNGDVFSTNSIDLYLAYCFKTINQECQVELNELAKKLAERTISELDFLGGVINLISFPEKIFSNVKNTNIRVNNPTISCEKEALKIPDTQDVTAINV